MPETTDDRSGDLVATLTRVACPAWCATGHGVQLGEEDWVHLGEPVLLTDGVSAQLCMTIDPSARYSVICVRIQSSTGMKL